MIAALLAVALGALNPNVTQANIGSTICSSGWTATVRPPASWTDRLKRSQLLRGLDPSHYEEDHVIPLELGGAPKDPKNLRPQLWAGPDGAKAKDDQVETPTRRAVCAGKMTLKQGQAAVRAWITHHSPY